MPLLLLGALNERRQRCPHPDSSREIVNELDSRCLIESHGGVQLSPAHPRARHRDHFATTRRHQAAASSRGVSRKRFSGTLTPR